VGLISFDTIFVIKDRNLKKLFKTWNEEGKSVSLSAAKYAAEAVSLTEEFKSTFQRWEEND